MRWHGVYGVRPINPASEYMTIWIITQHVHEDAIFQPSDFTPEAFTNEPKARARLSDLSEWHRNGAAYFTIEEISVRED